MAAPLVGVGALREPSLNAQLRLEIARVLAGQVGDDIPHAQTVRTVTRRAHSDGPGFAGFNIGGLHKRGHCKKDAHSEGLVHAFLQ